MSQARSPLSDLWPLWAAKLVWGMYWAAWEVMVPSMQRRLGMSDAELGQQLMMIVIGVLPATFIGGRSWARLGKFQLPLTLLIYAIATFWVAHASTKTELGLALLLIGAASGMLEVTLTCLVACAQDLTGRKLFSFAQSLFPLAVVVTAPVVGALRSAGVSPALIFTVIGLLFLAIAIAAAGSRIRLALPTPSMRLVRRTAAFRFSAPLAVLTLLGFFLYAFEHSINHWSSLFLQRDFGADPFLASWGPSVYMGAAYIGRMTVYKFHHLLPDLNVIFFGLGAGAVSLFLVSVATGPFMVLAVFMVAGLAMSPAIPAVYSLVADTVPSERRTQALGNVSLICNIGYLASPFAFGLFSTAFGMSVSWALMAMLALLCMAGLISVRRVFHSHRATSAALKEPSDGQA